jgi:hypothetical protein
MLRQAGATFRIGARLFGGRLNFDANTLLPRLAHKPNAAPLRYHPSRMGRSTFTSEPDIRPDDG